MPGAEAGGQRPVFALDVMDDAAPRPRQQRRHDQANTLARSRRCEAQHMLGAVMAEIVGAQLAQHHAVLAEQTRGRSEEHTSELQSLMRISYAVFCLKKKINIVNNTIVRTIHYHIEVALPQIQHTVDEPKR